MLPPSLEPSCGGAGKGYFDSGSRGRGFEFSNDLVEVPSRRGFALRDAVKDSQPHGGTELGKAVGLLPARDRLIVITDEQSHDLVPQQKGYMINVASNKNGVGYGRLHLKYLTRHG